jgi:hypothetical protein
MSQSQTNTHTQQLDDWRYQNVADGLEVLGVVRFPPVVADIVVSYLWLMQRPSRERDPPDAVNKFIARRKLRATYFLSGDGATAILVERNRS